MLLYQFPLRGKNSTVTAHKIKLYLSISLKVPNYLIDRIERQIGNIVAEHILVEKKSIPLKIETYLMVTLSILSSI